MRHQIQRQVLKILGCLFLSALAAHGQGGLFQSELKPVRATLKASQKEAAPGDSFDLVVQIRMTRNFHIYGGNDTNSPNIPTTVNLTLPKGLTPAGEWTNAPTAVKSKDGPLIYTNAVAFHHMVNVSPNAPHQALNISVALRYQACDDNECFPPETLTLETPITIVDRTNSTHP